MSREKKKVSSQRMICAFIVYHPPKIMEVKTRLNTTGVKLPVASRVNPPFFKCLLMVERYVKSRDVIHCLTNNEIMLC